MKPAKAFDRGDVFRQINARRQEINSVLRWQKEFNRQDPDLTTELGFLSDLEDDLLEPFCRSARNAAA